MERYPHWWPWLGAFDGRALATGEQWSCVVQPPFRYVLRFRIHLDDVVPETAVTATIDGDIVGTARLALDHDGAGSAARLTSRLAPNNRMLQVVARVARPVVRYGHDWVLDTGARQFSAQFDGSRG